MSVSTTPSRAKSALAVRNGPVAAAGLPDKVPPQNLEAERSVLGSIMSDNARLDEITEKVGLEPDHFYRDKHQAVYWAILFLHRQGVPFDVAMVFGELERREQLKELGGLEFLNELRESAIIANCVYHAEVVKQMWIARSIIQIGREAERDVYSGLLTPQQILERQQNRLSELPGRQKDPRDKELSAKPILTVRGNWATCLHNSLLWLEREGLAASVRYDRFLQAVLVDGRKLDDDTVIGIAARIEANLQTGWYQEHVRSALLLTAHRNAYSSLTEWLDSLRWDGTTRLDRFFPEAYGSQESQTYEEACARVLFLSAVARAYQPGCQADVMVVLISPQGLGKSTGIAALCPEPAWFADDLGCDLFDHKAGEGLRGKWLIEFAEFSRINRATIDVVKAFVSRRSDYYRPAYGRIHKDFPRTCVFVGTTNEDHPLHDRENRRFMPIRCSEARKDWIEAHRDQLWAEAVALYRQGESWWVRSPTLLAEVTARQEEARQGDFWETILEQKLGHIQSITMEMATEALNLGIDRVDRSTQTRIGLAFKALGYNRTRPWGEGKRPYVWTR